MKIIILGASGLIGHTLFQKLSERFDCVYGILHSSKEKYKKFGIFENDKVIDKIDVLTFNELEKIFQTVDPDVVLNCVGVTKRKDEIKDIEKVLLVNAVFPHKLANWAKKNKKRVIHFSTDCVFNGKEGNYTEESVTTGEDIYGKSKALGEIKYKHTLTIRSSFIGQELSGKTELLEWFLSQSKSVKGFRKSLYSGVSTIFMSKIVCDIIEFFPNLSGLYQLATQVPISKYELICIANDYFNKNIEIIPEDLFETKPTLVGDKLQEIMKFDVPSWNEMMEELSINKEFYS